MWQTGAIGAVPAGQGVVEGNEIPYRPEALQKKRENLANRQREDPEARCYLPGIPRASPDHMLYEATIEDPSVFTRPWKISMTLYRKVEKNAQLLEFKCVPFSEELLYGEFKKK
jgi:hypothetical protein